MAGIYVEVAAMALEKQRLGYSGISLTHFADAVEPQIAAGSKLETGSALYDFPTDETITGLAAIANNSQIYIRTTVAGTDITASGTVAAPAWSTSKQGWYIGTDRVIGGMYKDGSGNYTKKWLYRANSGGIQSVKEYGDGTMAVLPSSAIAALVTSAAFGWTMSDAGNHALADTGSTYVIPAGLYLIAASPANGVRFQVFEEGSWRDVNISGGMVIFSDGINVRAFGVSAVTIYLKKLE
jgi:hypothetical protein